MQCHKKLKLKILTSLALPNNLGWPASPKHIPHIILDLPDPLAPAITFSLAPGINSTSSNVLKDNNTIERGSEILHVQLEYAI